MNDKTMIKIISLMVLLLFIVGCHAGEEEIVGEEVEFPHIFNNEYDNFETLNQTFNETVEMGEYEKVKESNKNIWDNFEIGDTCDIEKTGLGIAVYGKIRGNNGRKCCCSGAINQSLSCICELIKNVEVEDTKEAIVQEEVIQEEIKVVVEEEEEEEISEPEPVVEPECSQESDCQKEGDLIIWREATIYKKTCSNGECVSRGDTCQQKKDYATKKLMEAMVNEDLQAVEYWQKSVGCSEG